MSSSTTKVRGIDYGWIIVGACFLITTIAFGAGFSFGVFLNPFRESFGWTSRTISVAYSIQLLTYTGMATFTGLSVDRYGPRVTTMIGGFVFGTSLLLASQVNTIWQLYMTYGLMGIGMSVAYTPPMTTVVKWFTRRRGLALGIVSAGMGAGPLILAPLAGYLISVNGWRFTFLMMGAMTYLIILAALLLKRSPQEDRGNISPPQTSPASSNYSLLSSDFSLREALGTRAFWLIAFMFMMVGVGLQMVLAHVVAYSEIKGLSPVTAATILSTISGASIAGRIIAGIISDRFGRKKVLTACVFIEGMMIFWLIGAEDIWALFAAAAIFGFGYGGHSAQFPALTGETLGLSHMGAILGAAVFFWGIGGALGTSLAGHIVDLTGSYSGAFLIGAVAMLLTVPASFFLKTPKKREIGRSL